jgi:hypothetical protein
LAVAPGRADAQSSPVETANPAFQASLDRIAKRSTLWRSALDAIRATGRRAIVLTPDQVDMSGGRAADRRERFDDTFLAEVAPVAGIDGRVDVVLVVVNLALLQERHERRQLLPIELDMDLDRILIHEIYGHAIPYLLAGQLSGRCPDPLPGTRAVDACSISRENAVRAELGLGRRVDYGLDGLNLSRRH